MHSVNSNLTILGATAQCKRASGWQEKPKAYSNGYWFWTRSREPSPWIFVQTWNTNIAQQKDWNTAQTQPSKLL